MSKYLACLVVLIALLTGCSESKPSYYKKTSGEVIGKHITGGRWGDSYYITVSYDVSLNKYAIEDINVDDKSNYDKYNGKDKVTVYVNKNNIKIIKEQ